ncbi:CoA-disulfide reductase [Sporosarcina pasteurii]|uniref:Coenzyme A disulfide reductase n=1 Tax=Sporosarcina pasteurii TaxID=1474 RepID=A0A380BE53_SPOPA|nr:CoA-disulfide reductase [Sporosarcina pasteurii]MDS9470364.1 CoA-disulfide reductase [Sporosarcina pasteurii]QBQ05927.1 CoA-disulfide reductase [Sporosarcina pasteurii]SUI99885.1 Coenzyme A disulfide reductase [Sporosarcina pasteurii]
MKIIIVGAIAGGSTVASQIRRTLPNASITLIGSDSRIGYGSCGMPFVIGGLIEDKEKIGGPNPKRFSETRNIRTLVKHQVTSINRKSKTVEVCNLETNETFQVSYDKLILSTGCHSRVPSLKGLGDLPFFTLKSYADMEEIVRYLDTEKPQSCAVMGGGFIGIELVENFIRRGIQTALILRGNRVMSSMDKEITDVLYEEMKANDVDFYFNDEIERIEGNRLIMKNGVAIKTDFLVASIGVIPNTSLAIESGLTIGVTDGVVVNEYMQTDDPDIYAIGDIAECIDWVTGKPKRVQLAWHAHRQAFIVSSHLADRPVKLNPFLGTTITKLFSLTAGMVGLSEQDLRAEGFDFDTVSHEGRTNAGYYPDHGTILIRVHFDRNTRQILGAQAVGNKGVDKRLDILVTAMMGNMTVDDLAALELSYSPPYSSPKDPINLVGYKANL